MDGQTQGKQKVQNKWQPIECKEDCEYRIKNGQGRPMCNEEGTLKFMLPDICTDKIWYMKITGYTSIETLRDYINFQKQLGNSLIGDYVIFLKDVEQINFEGKKFKNKILDIVRKEDFVSNNQTVSSNQIIPQNENNQTQLSTKQENDVENTVENQKVISSEGDTIQNNIVEKKAESKVKKVPENKTTKKVQKSTTDELKETTKTDNSQKDEDISNKYDKCHMLLDTETKMLMKDGKPTEYLFANFVDTHDQTLQVIIPPQLAEELKQCDLGTAVILDLQTKGDKTFTNSIEYVEKCVKNAVA
jgi:hypothetical protein